MDASSIQIGTQGNAEFLAAGPSENAASPETSFLFAPELVRALHPLQSAPADANQVADEAEAANPGESRKHSVGSLVGFAAHAGMLGIAEGGLTAHVPGVAAAIDLVPPAPLTTDLDISGDSVGTSGEVINESEMASVLDRVDHGTRRHLSMLEGLLSKVPDQARSAITHALRVSIAGNETALSMLSRTPAADVQAGFSSLAGPEGGRLPVDSPRSDGSPYGEAARAMHRISAEQRSAPVQANVPTEQRFFDDAFAAVHPRGGSPANHPTRAAIRSEPHAADAHVVGTGSARAAAAEPSDATPRNDDVLLPTRVASQPAREFATVVAAAQETASKQVHVLAEPRSSNGASSVNILAAHSVVPSEPHATNAHVVLTRSDPAAAVTERRTEGTLLRGSNSVESALPTGERDMRRASMQEARSLTGEVTFGEPSASMRAVREHQKSPVRSDQIQPTPGKAIPVEEQVLFRHDPPAMDHLPSGDSQTHKFSTQSRVMRTGATPVALNSSHEGGPSSGTGSMHADGSSVADGSSAANLGALAKGAELGTNLPTEPASTLVEFSAGQPAARSSPRSLEQIPSAENPAPQEVELPSALAAWKNSWTNPDRIVQNARLLGRLNQAEMHIALRPDALGPVELSAVVRNGEIGAAIRVESWKAHAILASELPALEHALTERALRVDSITVSHGSPGAGTALSGGSESHSGDFTQSQQRPARLPLNRMTENTGDVVPEVWAIADGPARLNVHA